MSVGFTITFTGAQDVYGLPEHATDLSLKTTTQSEYKEPYRLYNLDVFEYELDEPMALYGAIPMLVARNTLSKPATLQGAFFHNPSETFVDVTALPDGSKQVHFMAESGVLDVFVFVGPELKDILDAYTSFTGRPELPPIFSLGYHQCRWNYRTRRTWPRCTRSSRNTTSLSMSCGWTLSTRMGSGTLRGINPSSLLLW